MYSPRSEAPLCPGTPGCGPVPGPARTRVRAGLRGLADAVAVGADDVGVAAAAALDGSPLRRVVHVHQAEPLVVAVGPFEVVQQGPREVAAEGDAPRRGGGAGRHV